MEYAAMCSVYIDGEWVYAAYSNDFIKEGQEINIGWSKDIEELRQKIHY